MNELTKKLIAIQSKLNAPKNQRNKFGNYNYRSAEDILEAVKPLLLENEVALVVYDEIVQFGDRFYVKATAELSDGENKIAVSAFAREEDEKKGMDAAQLTGATSSYARKYAMNGLFAIDDNKDADATNTHGRDNQSKQAQGLKPRNFTKAEADAAKQYAIELDPTHTTRAYECTLQELGVSSLEELPYSEKPKYLKLLRENVAEFAELDGGENGEE
jgi:erf family protein|nr:MAG TPA: ERF superfamily protein [Caudoviricetes sp.]